MSLKYQEVDSTSSMVPLTFTSVTVLSLMCWTFPDNTVHGANMGPTWGLQDPGGPHVSHMKLAIWVAFTPGADIVWVTLQSLCDSTALLWTHSMHYEHFMALLWKHVPKHIFQLYNYIQLLYRTQQRLCNCNESNRRMRFREMWLYFDAYWPTYAIDNLVYCYDSVFDTSKLSIIITVYSVQLRH